MIKGYIPRDQRKKILFMCDDIRMTSGISTMAREIVIGTSHRFNWINLGGAIEHPDAGKRLDISDDIKIVRKILWSTKKGVSITSIYYKNNKIQDTLTEKYSWSIE